ncbi:glycosidase [Sphingomonas sp. S-NIH.Pt3_0716]|nr:glycosidase [Sphingomonas sp. S-NIH.Pt3_0716]
MTHSPPGERAPTGAVPPLRSCRTEIELIWIEKRLEHWIRFGRIAAERIVSRKTRIVSFRPDAMIAFVRWSANDYGTIHSRIDILRAVRTGEPYTTAPFVRPGGELLLSIQGWPKVQRVLQLIDAIEVAGLDPCEVAPDHWRHTHNRLSAGEPVRAYTPERHRAWLRRKALGQ